ncbi:MAG: IS200/IS605 family transposase [Pseudomonadota bacterium]
MSNKIHQKSSHTVHDLKVHLVWSTKYRYEVLDKEIGERIRDLTRQVCNSLGISIIKGRVSRDHMHLYISYAPKLSISEIVRRIKGRTSRKIQEEFPQLGKKYWGKHFWGIGYAAFSSGQITDEMVKAYLDAHDKKSNDEDFKVE